MDIGKPLQTTYRVSGVCPTCGSGEYKTVQPNTMVAYTWDRVCRVCSTRYTPPTPIWAKVIFGIGGVGFIAISLLGLPLSYFDYQAMGLLKPVIFIRGIVLVMAFLVGCGCLYKAATK
jgi:hypothetical protein